ncbi:MAG: hypothetical protein M1830_006947 [Pleopsidium flavum]|nr:MAG: hypothetical protein M1830_006947 [Pleopsidium flavum]
MAQHPPTLIRSAEVPKRPKGILKNSYRNTPASQISPPREVHTVSASAPAGRPELDRTLPEKDITLQNTLQNAGHRRSSSHARASVSRRQSTNGVLTNTAEDDNNPRLKWDEANLYLTEQEKSSTMKIDEPKTPYAKRYDPDEDEAEMRTLDADDLVVDELDKVEGSKSRTREDEIPGLELGEPEEAILGSNDGGSRITRSGSLKGEKQVVVDPAEDGLGGHGEGNDLNAEEREKHRKFEEMRKRHYEMKDVKGLLGHSEELDEMDEDEDSPDGPPQIPVTVGNGGNS